MQSLQEALVLAACVHLRCDPGDRDGLEVPDDRQIFLYETQAGASSLAAKVCDHSAKIREAR